MEPPPTPPPAALQSPAAPQTSPVSLTPPTLTEPMPVLPTRRVEALDVLRGIAVLGIFPVNILSMAGPEAWTYAPMELAVFSPLDAAAQALVDVFFSFKFITLFSLMFGAGVLMMARRNAQRGDGVYAVHYRRMAGLAVIGIAHAWLVWDGDVLFTYAVCGSLVVLMRNWPVRWLVTGAAVSFAVSLLLTVTCAGTMLLAQHLSPQEWAREMDAIFSAGAMDAEIAAYTGGLVDQMRYRIPAALAVQTWMIGYWSLWWVGGLMLIGMAYYRLGLLTAEADPARCRRIARVTLPIGLVLTLVLFGASWMRGIDAWALFSWALVPFGLVALVMSTGYLALVMLWMRSGRGGALRHALACVGRTALTCYLLQSLIGGLIFYGHGLGLYGQIGRAGQMGIVLTVWGVQLVAATAWLRVLPQGPMEWLWRVATYWGRPRGVTVTGPSA